MDSGIERSLYSSCHHDIIYRKINVRFLLPPPHFRTISDYKNADINSIQHAIERFNWHMHLKVKLLMKRYRSLVKC